MYMHALTALTGLTDGRAGTTIRWASIYTRIYLCAYVRVRGHAHARTRTRCTITHTNMHTQTHWQRRTRALGLASGCVKMWGCGWVCGVVCGCRVVGWLVCGLAGSRAAAGARGRAAGTTISNGGRARTCTHARAHTHTCTDTHRRAHTQDSPMIIRYAAGHWACAARNLLSQQPSSPASCTTSCRLLYML